MPLDAKMTTIKAAYEIMLPVFSSVRGHAKIQPRGTLSETAWVDRMILYIPPN